MKDCFPVRSSSVEKAVGSRPKCALIKEKNVSTALRFAKRIKENLNLASFSLTLPFMFFGFHALALPSGQ